jgi:adenosylmethionine-8-amino-7-oxononanoate aminotransferase
LAQVAALSTALAEALEPCRGLPGVSDVRMLGGIGVVELKPGTQAAALRGALLDEGVWVRPFGCVVYLTPAFTIGADDLARLTAAVRRVVERWSRTLEEPA